MTDAEVPKATDRRARRRRSRTLQKQLKAFDGKKPPLAAGRDGADRQARPAAEDVPARTRRTREPRRPRCSPASPRSLSPGGKAADATIEPLPDSTGRRLALAKWIASKDNPLTARVIVNRLWQHHFGRGIVATASDFGLRGERPDAPGVARLAGVRIRKPPPRTPPPAGEGLSAPPSPQGRGSGG